MTSLVVKPLLTAAILIAVLLFFPIALFFAVCDAVWLCAWIGRDCLVNLWSGEWR